MVQYSALYDDQPKRAVYFVSWAVSGGCSVVNILYDNS